MTWGHEIIFFRQLVGGLVAIVYFPIDIYIYINIGNVIIPIDELIFFRGVAQPPTRLIGWRVYSEIDLQADQRWALDLVGAA